MTFLEATLLFEDSIFMEYWPLLLIVIVWDAFWKLIGLWKSARNNTLLWFICIGVLNTAGILPIVYILLYRKKPGIGPAESQAMW